MYIVNVVQRRFTTTLLGLFSLSSKDICHTLLHNPERYLFDPFSNKRQCLQHSKHTVSDG